MDNKPMTQRRSKTAVFSRHVATT